jgi:hypothetical protein
MLEQLVFMSRVSGIPENSKTRQLENDCNICLLSQDMSYGLVGKQKNFVWLLSR